MKNLSRILTIALLTVVMPSFAQQEFVFKNMKDINNDSVYTITITKLENGNYTIKSFNQGNASTTKIISSAPFELDKEDTNRFNFHEFFNLFFFTYSVDLSIYPNKIFCADVVEAYHTKFDLRPLNKDAYTREFNRMKQVLLGGSSVQNSTNITASVEKVWVDHNVFENGVKGMRIHVKFNINGMLNKTGRAIAYFYYNNGNPLKDTNNRFYSVDGNVSVGENFTPSYERSTFNDLTIFMPYSELELSQSAQCYFFVEIKDDNRYLRATSDKVYFDYTR